MTAQAGALEELEAKLRRELRDLAETRLALEKLGLHDKVWEVEREMGRIRIQLHEIEKLKQEGEG